MGFLGGEGKGAGRGGGGHVRVFKGLAVLVLYQDVDFTSFCFISTVFKNVHLFTLLSYMH